MSSSPAEGPRFSEWTSTDHRAPLWITTSLSLIYSCSFLCVRLVVKYRRWALDDIVLGAAYVGLAPAHEQDTLTFDQLLSLAQWAVIYTALDRGAGRIPSSLGPDSLGTPGKLVFASTSLTLLSLGLSKCSTILFLRLVFTRENKRAWRLCNALLVVFGCWTVASTLIVSVGCSPKDALGSGKSSQCTSEVARWAAVTAIDVFLELAIVLVAAHLFSTLQMRISTKITVTSAFCFRLGVPALFIAYLILHTSFREHGRPSIDAVDSLVLQQTLLAYGLMAATVPGLKGFLGRFRTGDLTRLAESDIMESDVLREWVSRSKSTPRGQSYALSSMDGTKLGKVRRAKNQFSAMLQPDGTHHSTHAWAERQDDQGRSSIPSSGSEQMIIHRTVGFDVVTR